MNNEIEGVSSRFISDRIVSAVENWGGNNARMISIIELINFNWNKISKDDFKRVGESFAKEGFKPNMNCGMDMLIEKNYVGWLVGQAMVVMVDKPSDLKFGSRLIEVYRERFSESGLKNNG